MKERYEKSMEKGSGCILVRATEVSGCRRRGDCIFRLSCSSSYFNFNLSDSQSR